MATIPNTLRIRNALENAIVEGKYPPGARLDPEALEREFEVSRTPIREALHQLEASGLVRVVPKRGTFVTEWSASELAERFEVMAEIEATCGRLAAPSPRRNWPISRPFTRSAADWPRPARSRPIMPAIRISTIASIVRPIMPFWRRRRRGCMPCCNPIAACSSRCATG